MEITCSTCGETKPSDQFPATRKRCKSCTSKYQTEWQTRNRERTNVHARNYRERNRKKVSESQRRSKFKIKYGITLGDYDRMLTEQGGHCAICPATEPGRAGRKYLYVDHCHSTGRVRGLLCGNCNNGLGWFKDDPIRLQNAIAYLA